MNTLMKRKKQILVTIAILALFNVQGQTHFFKENVTNGSIWYKKSEKDGVRVDAVHRVENPKKTEENKSDFCIVNDGTKSWQDAQITPKPFYTIKEGDKLYISFYNPNGAYSWQLNFVLSTYNYTQIGNFDHDLSADSEWKEVEVDLSKYLGQDIMQIKIFSAHEEELQVFFDNIYIGQKSVLK